MFALVAVLSILATTAGAGTICGTVRQAGTLTPIQSAGLFLFDDANVYTGIHTASASDGSFCLTDVPVGTYTLQVRRDDYLIATVEDIVVDEAVDVTIDATTSVLFARPFPNPTTTAVLFRFRAPAGAPLTLEVFDVAGRRQRSWSGIGSGTEHTVEWDMRNFEGGTVALGVYHAVLKCNGITTVHRFLYIR